MSKAPAPGKGEDQACAPMCWLSRAISRRISGAEADRVSLTWISQVQIDRADDGVFGRIGVRLPSPSRMNREFLPNDPTACPGDDAPLLFSAAI